MGYLLGGGVSATKQDLGRTNASLLRGEAVRPKWIDYTHSCDSGKIRVRTFVLLLFIACEKSSDPSEEAFVFFLLTSFLLQRRHVLQQILAVSHIFYLEEVKCVLGQLRVSRLLVKHQAQACLFPELFLIFHQGEGFLWPDPILELYTV